MMVWNITPQAIRVRQVIAPEDTWPARSRENSDRYKSEKRGTTPPFSDWLEAGRLKFDDALNIIN
jgi:hypothetical protein